MEENKDIQLYVDNIIYDKNKCLPVWYGLSGIRGTGEVVIVMCKTKCTLICCAFVFTNVIKQEYPDFSWWSTMLTNH